MTGALGARVPGAAAGAAGRRVTELPDGSLAAAPLPTPATTRRPVPAGLPRLLLTRAEAR